MRPPETIAQELEPAVDTPTELDAEDDAEDGHVPPLLDDACQTPAAIEDGAIVDPVSEASSAGPPPNISCCTSMANSFNNAWKCSVGRKTAQLLIHPIMQTVPWNVSMIAIWAMQDAT